MKLDFGDDKSIYLQIAENIEEDIVRGNLEEETQIPSTNQMAVLVKINPATAGKGINILVDEGILYKKRGIGMFVAKWARERIIGKRKSEFYDKFIISLLSEAQNIGISKEEIIHMINFGGKSHE